MSLFKKAKWILSTIIMFGSLLFSATICVYAAHADGIIHEYNVIYFSPFGSLASGDNFNVALKRTANNGANSSSYVDTKVQKIVFDYYNSSYQENFDWDSDYSQNLDTSENSNIRLFYSSENNTMYILSPNKINVSNCQNMFLNFRSLTSVEFNNFNSSGSTTHKSMFSGCSNLTSFANFNNLTTLNSTDLSSMFYGCSKISNLNLSNFNTSKVATFSQMFYDCSSLNSLDFGNLNTANGEQFYQMFYNCSQLSTLSRCQINLSKAINSYQMFYGCQALSQINTSSFSAPYLQDAHEMFCGCSDLSSINLSNFNAPNATLFNGLLKNCSSLSEVVLFDENSNTFVTDSATNTSEMFSGDSMISSLDFRYLNIQKVTNMEKMFYNCSNLTTITVSNVWNVISVESSNNMFYGCSNIVGGYNTTYNSSKTDKEYAHVDLSSNPGYLTATSVQYRGLLIYDEWNTLLGITYLGSDKPYVLPQKEEFDYYKQNNTTYNVLDTINYDDFSGNGDVDLVVYVKRYAVTFRNGTNGGNVTKTVTYYEGSTLTTLTSGDLIPAGTNVSISVSVGSGYRNPTVSATKTSSGDSYSLTTVSEYSSYSFVMPSEGITLSFSASTQGFCFAPGTMITLYNGDLKRVEDLSLDDSLLIINHETGEFDEGEITFIEVEPQKDYSVMNLEFSDGTKLKFIDEHGLFDKDLNKYVYFKEDVMLDFIGHTFIGYEKTCDGFKTKDVVLTNAYITTENIVCYSLVTKYHLNYFTNTMLSMPGGISGLFNIFDYINLKYDEQQKQTQLEEYGEFSYDDFKDYVSYEDYSAYPVKYLKVSIAKGLLTEEFLNYLIERYCTK